MVGGWALNIGTEYVFDSSVRAHVPQDVIINTPYIPYINMMIFAIGLIYFFYDLFVTVQEEAPKVGEKVSNKVDGNGGFQ